MCIKTSVTHLVATEELKLEKLRSYGEEFVTIISAREGIGAEASDGEAEDP